MHVLVIEDKPFSRELLCYLLHRAGHTVVEAADGNKGLAAARGEAFDLILCDLNLPGLPGIELVKALRADPATARLFIVAVTLHDAPGARAEVMAAGFDYYYPKPVDVITLVGELEALAKGAYK